MQTTYVVRRKPLWKRLRWDNILLLLSIVTIVTLFGMWYESLNDYEIQYVPYQMEPNDSLINVVQDMNTYTPHGWDARDFVALAKDRNNISDVGKIRVWQTIEIPVAKPKE